MESRVVNAEYIERILNLLANGKWVGELTSSLNLIKNMLNIMKPRTL